MVFVNQIGEVVHSIVDRFLGAANKNIGDAFLLVWSIDKSWYSLNESTNEIIEIAGVVVAPGDLVIADGSGVVFVSAERAEEVISAAETIAAREAEMTKAVKEGHSVVEVMGRNYETMLSR